MPIVVVSRRWLGVLAVMLACCLWPAGAAQAQSPCSGAAGERMVGMTQASNGVAAIPLCVQDAPAGGYNSGYNNGGVVSVAPTPNNSYAAIAWHPDASDVWFDGGYLAPGSAEPGALAACNRAMGGGCSSPGEWSNSSTVVIRDRNGGFFTAWLGKDEKEVDRVLDECSSKQVLPCEVFMMFTSRMDHHFPGPEARIAYAAGAWVDGVDGYNRKLYVASGYRSDEAATELAMNACQTENPSRKCEVAVQANGGFFQTATFDVQRDFSTVERTEARVRLAAEALCRKNEAVNCQLQAVFDSRRRGQFVHDYGAWKGR